MKGKFNKNSIIISVLIVCFIILAVHTVHGAPTDFPIPNIDISVDNASTP